MADEALTGDPTKRDADRLALLHFASTGIRFRLLAAAADGSFLETRCAAIAGVPETRAGTVRKTHLKGLSERGLLIRSPTPVTYHITDLGSEIYEALRRALGDPPPSNDERALVILAAAQASVAREAAEAERIDLTLALSRGSLERSITRQRTFRLSRTD
jgi:hypothetical protein